MKSLSLPQGPGVLRQLGMPLGLADHGVLALDPAVHVVALEREHPCTQLAGGDHALQAATPNAWVDQTWILDLFGIVVEETA